MIITNLEVSNVKKIRAINITPNKSMVVVGGENEQGKTSALDGIMFALGGSRTICDGAVRRGEESAEIIATLGELVVTRTIQKDGTSYLKIKDENGNVSSPQTLLDKFTTSLTFDPLEFSNMPQDKQLKTLKELVGIDFTELDEKRKTAYEERTLIGRLRDKAIALVDSLPVPVSFDIEQADASDILEKLSEANKTNNEIDNAERDCQHITSEITKNANEIAALELKIKGLIKINEALETQLEIRKLLATQAKVDTEALEDDLRNIEQTNSDKIAADKYLEAEKEYQKMSNEYNLLSQKIADIDAEKTNMLSAVKFPIEGLAFGEDGILFEGLPFKNASSAGQLKVSIAIGLAMNPELNVLLIRNGSLLDDKNLALVAEIAEQHGAQVWVERVGKGDEVSLVIEDGLIIDDRDGMCLDAKTEPKQKRTRKSTKKTEQEEVTTVESTEEETVTTTEQEDPKETFTIKKITYHSIPDFESGAEEVMKEINESGILDEIIIDSEKDENKILDMSDIVIEEEVASDEPEPEPVIPESDGIAIVNTPTGKRSIIDDDIDYDSPY